jgi:hypothetical protein
MKNTKLLKLVPEINTRNLMIMSAALVAFIFLMQGNTGFDLADEGYLWYGTIRANLGEIPLRDFQSYDPGRYYWGVIFFKLLRNDGIMALRVSQAVFQWLGLALAFLVLRRVTRSWLSLLAAGTVFLIWMFPPWKIYEPVITIAAVYFAVRLIEKPAPVRHLIAGIFVGLAAFFGRNHGLYCFAGFLFLTIFIWWKLDRGSLLKRLAKLGLGILIGYSPMLIMMATVKGFGAAVIQTILLNVHQGTNLPLPVPWPWAPDYSHLSFKESIHALAVGILYLLFPAFYVFTAGLLLFKSRARRNVVLIACTFIGAAYLHYIFERPHVYYLAWSIPPLILGCFALPLAFPEHNRKMAALIAWSVLLILTWPAAEMAPENYFLMKAKSAVRQSVLERFHIPSGLDMPATHYSLIKTDIGGDKLWLTYDSAEVINSIREATRDRVAENDGMLIAPYWTSLYPVLRKPSPLWEIYFLFPQPRERQEKMVEELGRKQTRWAFICHFYLDNRPELAFENTHGYVWHYLVENFHPVVTELPRTCELLVRNDVNPTPSAQPSAYR